MIRLEDLLALPGATLLTAGPATFGNVKFDTRTLTPGDLFVALTGAARDGHAFITSAVHAGAAGVLVAMAPAQALPGVTVVQVPDTLVGLQQLAAAARQRFAGPVISITGSVGKTTTKAMTAAVLAAGHRPYANEASFNNHIGVPLTLLGINGAHSHAVSEIGTNHRGEIAALAALVDPDLAVVTTVGYAHLGNFSSREDLAAEKTDLLRAVRPGGHWIINADDPLIAAEVAGIDRPDVTRTTVGFTSGVEVRAVDVVISPAGTSGRLEVDGQTHPLTLPTPGRHVVASALFALAIGRYYGVAVPAGIAALQTMSMPAGRAQVRDFGGGLTVIDDSYNASPDAMLSGLDLLAALPGVTKVAVLGEMRELGDHSVTLHALIGTHAHGRATDLVTIGQATTALTAAAMAAGHNPTRMRTVDSARAALAATADLLTNSPRPAVVLIKGSRFMHTERVHLGLAGHRVTCPLPVCTLYINCRECPQLSS